MNDPDAPKRPDRAVPDPHAGEPSRPPAEGLRPEADPDLTWPDQNEPGGPMAGLFQAAGAETAAHYAGSPAAAAIAEAAGVEAEGLESGQLFGLMLATAVAIVMLILTVYFLFYSPLLQETRAVAADVPLDRYVELRDSRVAGVGLISDYAVNEDSTYRLPIDAAMQLTAAAYASGTPAPSVATPDPGTNGLSWLTLTPPAAVRTVDGSGASSADTSAGPVAIPAGVQPGAVADSL
jgi:hypothetical protein